MALLLCDSFDHYAVSTDVLLGKWTSFGGKSGPVSTTGRFGSGLQFQGGTTDRALRKNFSTSHSTWIIGLAYQHVTPGSEDILFSILDSGSIQIDVRVNPSGQLRVVCPGASPYGTTILSAGVWYYLELKAVIGNAGSFELRVNGITELSNGSVDTQATANATANGVQLDKLDQSATNFDDVYVCDGSGSTNNDFLGDVRIQAILPNGNGNSSVLVGSDGNSTDNYLLVDENPANSDTDYVESSTVGDKDTYAYGNVTPTTGTVYAVQILPWARKTDAGARSIATIARLSATEVDSANATLSTTYAYYPDVRETKPGGGAWSISDVNSAEFGVKVTA